MSAGNQALRLGARPKMWGPWFPYAHHKIGICRFGASLPRGLGALTLGAPPLERMTALYIYTVK